LLELPAYDRLRVDGARFTRGQVMGLRDALAGETLEQRCMRGCLERGRADVIVAGVTILLAALEHCGAEILVVRDRGLRYALV
jgi:exopolyphosphatase/guanosine-5'-triphosphate,3'-diphosphate pyrophosphatase